MDIKTITAIKTIGGAAVGVAGGGYGSYTLTSAHQPEWLEGAQGTFAFGGVFASFGLGVLAARKLGPGLVSGGLIGAAFGGVGGMYAAAISAQ